MVFGTRSSRPGFSESHQCSHAAETASTTPWGEATGDAEKDAIVEEDRGGAERVGGGGAAVVERAADQHGRGGERAVA